MPRIQKVRGTFIIGILVLRLLFPLFVIYFLLTACGPVAVPAPKATQRPENTATLQVTALPATPSPQPSQTLTATPIHLHYETVYQKDGFSIRQAFLGWNAIWHW